MDIVQQLLRERGGELAQNLIGEAGFSSDQAEGFLPLALQKVIAVLQGGDLDLGALLGGSGASSILSRLNVGELATEAGLDEAKAGAGISALIPALLSAIQQGAGGTEGLLASLGGEGASDLLGAAGGLAGKLFK